MQINRLFFSSFPSNQIYNVFRIRWIRNRGSIRILFEFKFRTQNESFQVFLCFHFIFILPLTPFSLLFCFFWFNRRGIFTRCVAELSIGFGTLAPSIYWYGGSSARRTPFQITMMYIYFQGNSESKIAEYLLHEE